MQHYPLWISTDFSPPRIYAVCVYQQQFIFRSKKNLIHRPKSVTSAISVRLRNTVKWQQMWEAGLSIPRFPHSPTLSCAVLPTPLPPFRARFRVTLLGSSGIDTLTCEKRSSVASFLEVWQLLKRRLSTTREWHDSNAPKCMFTEGNAEFVRV